ncbi:MAG: hydroxysqualene dehydroxylase [Phycisphaeraceae bacterium]
MQEQPGHGKHVIIVGDGHAGVAAAVRLTDLGYRVTVVESGVHVGQSTSGQATDASQHTLMRMCTNQTDLYRRLGVIRDIDWHKTLYFTGSDGLIDHLTGDDLPAPFHLTRGLMAMKRFTAREKFSIFAGFLAAMQVSRAAREKLSDESFRDWLVSVHQPEHVIDKFWSAIIAGACNQLPGQISAAYGVRILHEGFLLNNTSYQLGFSKMSRAEFYRRAEEIVTKGGGAVLHGVSVDRFEFDEDAKRVAGVHLTDGQTLDADSYVTALPHGRLEALATDPMKQADARLARLAEIEDVPILGIHLYFNAPQGHDTMRRSHLIFTDGCVRWAFAKGVEEGGPLDGLHHIHVVIGNAEDFDELPDDQIVLAAEQDMRKAMPGITDEVTLHTAHVVREQRAASAPRTGGKRYRPYPSGDIQNLFVAGDWASTGWPTSREGAVRSGYRAASALHEYLIEGDPVKNVNKLLIPDVKPSALYVAMSG